MLSSLPCFCTFYRSIPTWNEVLQKVSPCLMWLVLISVHSPTASQQWLNALLTLPAKFFTERKDFHTLLHLLGPERSSYSAHNSWKCYITTTGTTASSQHRTRWSWALFIARHRKQHSLKFYNSWTEQGMGMKLTSIDFSRQVMEDSRSSWLHSFLTSGILTTNIAYCITFLEYDNKFQVDTSVV